MTESITCDAEENIWPVWSHLNESLKGLPEIASSMEMIFVEKPFENKSMAKVWDFIRSDFHELIPVNVQDDFKWNKQETKSFLQHIREVADVEDSFNAQRKVLEVLDAGNRCNRWKIIIPYIPAPPPKRPASRFQSDKFQLFSDHQNIFDKLLASLSYIPKNDPQLEWGQIFSVFILFGGLVNGRRLLILPDSIKEPNRHFHWLDLEIDPCDGTEKIQFRHFLEPISRYFLVKRYSTDISTPPEKLTTRKIFNLIKHYAKAHGFENELPSSWSKLVDVAIMRYAIYLPHHLLGHLTAETQSTSLSSQTIERLIEPLPIKPDEKSAFSSKQGNAIKGIYIDTKEKDLIKAHYGVDDEEELWPAQLFELVKVIRAEATKKTGKCLQIRKWLSKFSGITGQGALLPSILRLAEWAEHWLFKDGPSRKALSISSAYGRYNPIASRLVSQLGDIDPVSLSSVDDYIEIYSIALDDTSTIGSRNRVALGLKSFHAYLVKHHDAPDLSSSDLFNHKKGSTNRVDANFIDPITFEKAMLWLEYQFQSQPDVANMLILVACLGYYSGLRRSEAVGLMVGDIEGEPDWDLHIQPNIYRTLKSGNANRISPLKCLWPSHHLECFIQFYNKRCKEMDDQNKSRKDFRLFALVGKETLREKDSVFDQITLALNQATHEANFRFHHLRHSFANRLLLMLWEAERIDDELNDGCLPRLSGFDDVKTTRDYLLGSTPLHRRGLWLIAKLMGHGDTIITVTHYLHFMDYLLGQALKRAVPDMNIETLAELTGKSKSHIKNIRHKLQNSLEAHILDKLTESLIKKEFKLTRKSTDISSDLNRIKIETPDNHFARFILLSRHIDKNKSENRLLEKMDFPWAELKTNQILETVKKLPLHFRKQNEQENNGLMDRPNEASEKDLAEAVFKYAYENVNEKELELLLGSYQMGKVSRKKRWLDVQFEKLSDVKRWIRFLKHLEIINLFTLLHSPCPASKAGSAQVQLDYWSNQTGMKVVNEENNINKVVTPARGFIIFKQNTAKGNGLHRAFYGICWALTMLLISTELKGSK